MTSTMSRMLSTDAAGSPWDREHALAMRARACARDASMRSRCDHALAMRARVRDASMRSRCEHALAMRALVQSNNAALHITLMPLGLENIDSNVGMNALCGSGLYCKRWGCCFLFQTIFLLCCFPGDGGHTILLGSMTSSLGVWNPGGNGWGIRESWGGE